MKSNFMESFEFYQNEIDILHYGKKGMKWGVRNTKPYVPVAERTQSDQTQKNQNDSVSDAAPSAAAVAEASPEKVSSTRKKVLKGLAIGGSVALVIGGIVAGGILAKKKAEKEEDAFIDSILSNLTSKTPFGGYVGGSGGNSENSNRHRTKAGMTSAGERLRRKVNGG